MRSLSILRLAARAPRLRGPVTSTLYVMSKKGRHMLLAALPVIYVSLFFLYAPAHLAAISWKAYWLVRPLDAYNNVAYQWWLEQLSRENWLVRIRNANNIWWCRQFTTCSVEAAK